MTLTISIRTIRRSISIQEAVLGTITYADLFDYPLTPPEIHRYLHGVRLTLQQLRAYLNGNTELCKVSHGSNEYFTLAGREQTVCLRQRREWIAQASLPRAFHYGNLLATIPYVRMVALTGSLAMCNAESDADFDYFIITSSGRLWLCRALIVMFVRWIQWRTRDTICPNLLISERSLQLPNRDIYTAHEVAQMIPIAGLAFYEEFRASNAWSLEFLPNSGGVPRLTRSIPPPGKHPGTAVERLLNHPIFTRLETWEMKRKIRRFTQKVQVPAESYFSPDWCQGHFNGHAHRILKLYRKKLPHQYLSTPEF